MADHGSLIADRFHPFTFQHKLQAQSNCPTKQMLCVLLKVCVFYWYQCRINSMSEKALITRAWKITNVCKLKSFVEVGCCGSTSHPTQAVAVKGQVVSPVCGFLSPSEAGVAGCMSNCGRLESIPVSELFPASNVKDKACINANQLNIRYLPVRYHCCQGTVASTFTLTCI